MVHSLKRFGLILDKVNLEAALQDPTWYNLDVHPLLVHGLL